MKAFFLRIHGRVQGVWFRASTQNEARACGVSGWVKNAPDGSVEAHVQGDEAAVEQLVQWCHQGPPGARVDRVEITPAHLDTDVKSFTIKY